MASPSITSISAIPFSYFSPNIFSISFLQRRHERDQKLKNMQGRQTRGCHRCTCTCSFYSPPRNHTYMCFTFCVLPRSSIYRCTLAIQSSLAPVSTFICILACRNILKLCSSKVAVYKFSSSPLNEFCQYYIRQSMCALRRDEPRAASFRWPHQHGSLLLGLAPFQVEGRATCNREVLRYFSSNFQFAFCFSRSLEP